MWAMEDPESMAAKGSTSRRASGAEQNIQDIQQASAEQQEGDEETGTRSPGNRSLERGIEILRAFRPGSDLLGNGELAERAGLPRATVSRLTRTLVDAGLLEEDRRHRAYRLAAPVLSLAHAMRSGSPVLASAGPMMRALAEKLRVNVGLAVADRDNMIYLESVRYARRVSLRNVVAGQRVPIELTSLGRAWLAVAPRREREATLQRLRERRSKGVEALLEEIEQAAESVRDKGYCWASWQPQVLSLATPLAVPGHPVYVLNISVGDAMTPEQAEQFVSTLSEPLMALAAEIREVIAQI